MQQTVVTNVMLSNIIPLVNHVYFTVTTHLTTAKIALKYDIFNYSFLLLKHDSLLFNKD